MMISNNQIHNLLRVYGVTPDKKVNAPGTHMPVENKKDKMSLSSEAVFFQTLQKAMADSPEIRKEKVEALQQKIQTGTYRPSGEDVAEKMLGRSLIDNIF